MKLTLDMPVDQIPRWPVRLVEIKPWRLSPDVIDGFVEPCGRHSRAWLFVPVDLRGQDQVLISVRASGSFWLSHCGKFAFPCAT